MSQPTAISDVRSNIVKSLNTKKSTDSITKSKPKKFKRKPSQRLRVFIKELAVNGGNERQAALKAEYSPSVVDNTKKITSSEAFKALYPKVLEDAGLTDERLAAIHAELVNATRTEKIYFGPREAPGKGRRKQRKMLMPDFEYVKACVEAEYPNRKYTIIADEQGFGYTAYIEVPAHIWRGKGLELAYKNKGHLAPDPLDTDRQHEATPVEKAVIDAILNGNK